MFPLKIIIYSNSVKEILLQFNKFSSVKVKRLTQTVQSYPSEIEEKDNQSTCLQPNV